MHSSSVESVTCPLTVEPSFRAMVRMPLSNDMTVPAESCPVLRSNASSVLVPAPMFCSILSISPMPYLSRKYSTADKDSAYATCACKSEKPVNECSSIGKGISFLAWNNGAKRWANMLELRGSISSAMPSLRTSVSRVRRTCGANPRCVKGCEAIATRFPFS